MSGGDSNTIRPCVVVDEVDKWLHITLVIPGLEARRSFKSMFRRRPKNAKVVCCSFNNRTICFKLQLDSSSGIAPPTLYEYEVPMTPGNVDAKKTYLSFKQGRVVLHVYKNESCAWARAITMVIAPDETPVAEDGSKHEMASEHVAPSARNNNDAADDDVTYDEKNDFGQPSAPPPDYNDLGF